ncbi:NUDIX hydrolase [Streptomyces chrestomyceticus]|uniref:NUDIX hydrolase n=1 Tax=Streptomyces chrestomyceticus TaxID=68185 RepID=UPI0033CCBD5B
MNSPDPLLTDHLSTDYLAQAHPRRIASQSLVRDHRGEILLGQSRRRLERRELLTWELPGGWTRADEDPRTACRRTIRQAFGVSVDPWGLLLMHWQPAQDGAAEEHTYIWNAARLRSLTPFQLATDGEVVQARFVPRNQLTAYVPEGLVERIDAALRAVRCGRSDYLTSRGR